ncbi:alpha/beta fold hydrolase [Buchnera aphidicola]|uniref:alpha/beta fold hydrolase n=1 Tax=Buchnera aphidicola TaxID=9 RepID=UPI00094D3B4F|nr:alpha/beta fold hydrolase [Buchnera aphidicola]
MYIIKHKLKIKKKINLVFFHGWGLDSNIWTYILTILKPYYNIYFIDFPGFGKNIKEPLKNFNEISQKILKKLPEKVIWIGWSMGGLMATDIGLKYPERTKGIILITSSPCFIEKKNWLGIKIVTLKKIKKEILTNYSNFLKSFQVLHIKNKLKINIHVLNFNNIKKNFLKPTKNSIKYGLKWLIQIDQRKKICNIQVPLLQIYGSLDNMVPARIDVKLKNLYQKHYSYVIPYSKHAPFFSHPKELCYIIMQFINHID